MYGPHLTALFATNCGSALHQTCNRFQQQQTAFKELHGQHCDGAGVDEKAIYADTRLFQKQKFCFPRRISCFVPHTIVIILYLDGIGVKKRFREYFLNIR